MATVVRYVNRASTAGGDGTTNATSGANRAYLDLAEGEAAEQVDLVAAGDILQFICEGTTEDSSKPNFNGWTTGAADYIHITAVASASAGRHEGKWDTGKYRLGIQGGPALNLNEEYIRVEGIQIEIRSNPWATNVSGITSGVSTATSLLQIWNVLFKGVMDSGNTLANEGLTHTYQPTLEAKNCAFHGFDANNQGAGGTACAIDASNFATWDLSNITVAKSSHGYNRGSATVRCKNCGFDSGGASGADGYAGGGYHADSEKNASDITSDAPGGNPITGSPTFEDEANDDFHLAAADSVYDSAGDDLSSDARFAFSDDFDFVTRSKWSVGADDGAAAAAADPHFLFRKRRGVVYT